MFLIYRRWCLRISFLFAMATLVLLPSFAGVLSMSPFAMAAAPIQSAAEIDYPPFSLVDANGRPDGFSIELMQAALAAMNRQVVFRTGPWSEVRGWLETGEIQALPLVGRTPERETLFDFTFAYMTLHGAIVVRKDNQDILNLSDLRGRRVAVMKGDNAEEFLRRKDYGIEFDVTDTFEEALQDLSQGKCDAVVIQRLVALRLLQETGLTTLRVLERPVEGFRQDFCFAVREGDRETLALLNEGLSIVMADGTYRRLHAKWFAALQLPLDRPVVIGGDYQYPPFEFLDDKGHPAGFTVDLTRAIAREMNMQIRVQLGSWADALDGLKSGKIDAIQGIFYSAERDRKFDFSQPYMISHYVSVVRGEGAKPPETTADLAGKRLVVQEGDAVYEFLKEKGLGDSIAVVETQEDVLRSILEGKYDCAVALRIGALYLMEKNGWTGLALGGRSLFSGKYCYAVPKGQGALLAQFSEGLKVVEESGEFHRIYEKWLGGYKEAPPPLLRSLRYSAMVLIPLAAILLAVFLWSWSLRKKVATKTRELQESLDRFKYVFESANVGKSMTLLTGEVNVNKAFADFLGYTQEELEGKRWQDLTPNEDIEPTEIEIASLLTGKKKATRFEKRYIHKSGELLWADVSASLRRNPQGEPLYFITTIIDITERKRTEKALHASEEFQRAMIACSPVALYSIDLQGNVSAWNASAERIFGWSVEEVISHPLPILPEGKEEEFAELRKFTREGEIIIAREVVRRRKDGTTFAGSLSTAAIKNAEGKVIGVMGAMEDITQRKLAEDSLRESESRFRLFAELAPVGIVISDENEKTLYASPKFTELFGYTKKDMPSVEEWWTLAYPDETLRNRIRREWSAAVDEAKKSRSETKPMQYPVSCKDGSIRDVEFRMATTGIFNVVVFTDVTERRKAEEEREKLQSQLTQAQKMESVGRLAGGVAHDFNNKLSVILGYTQMAMESMDQESPIHANLQQVFKAGKQSVEIVRQLLAFARKQTIAPRVLDLNETVEGMLKMLRRLIGEDIDLAWSPDTNLWQVKMDPAQIDQILANLCVNSRDAIPGVGKITIETENIVISKEYCADHAGFLPGDFVKLVVSDDGVGMDKETLASAFEPFFTTKEVGRGTGLGLSTVYGIVKQNQGFVNVYSEPGKGTTFRIYLPRHTGGVEELKIGAQPETPLAQGETVLIVEDEASVLGLARRLLEKLGYEVLTAASPGKAVETVRNYTGEIHLLLTDVVLPTMSGRDLAAKTTKIRPGIKTLFMSGYTANVIAHHGVLDAGVHFIEKPFTPDALARKIREAIGD